MTERTVVLKYCRDVESHLALAGSADAVAELTGLITDVRPVGRICFFTLRDVTGLVQLTANHEVFSDEAWAEVAKIRTGNLVTASGAVTRSKRGDPTILLSATPIVRETVLDSPISGGEVDYPHVGTQIFVARLRNRASEFLRDVGYLEIEPKLISANRAGKLVEKQVAPQECQYKTLSRSAVLLGDTGAKGGRRLSVVSTCSGGNPASMRAARSARDPRRLVQFAPCARKSLSAVPQK